LAYWSQWEFVSHVLWANGQEKCHLHADLTGHVLGAAAAFRSDEVYIRPRSGDEGHAGGTSGRPKGNASRPAGCSPLVWRVSLSHRLMVGADRHLDRDVVDGRPVCTGAFESGIDRTRLQSVNVVRSSGTPEGRTQGLGDRRLLLRSTQTSARFRACAGATLSGDIVSTARGTTDRRFGGAPLGQSVS